MKKLILYLSLMLLFSCGNYEDMKEPNSSSEPTTETGENENWNKDTWEESNSTTQKASKFIVTSEFEPKFGEFIGFVEGNNFYDDLISIGVYENIQQHTNKRFINLEFRKKDGPFNWEDLVSLDPEYFSLIDLNKIKLAENILINLDENKTVTHFKYGNRIYVRSKVQQKSTSSSTRLNSYGLVWSDNSTIIVQKGQSINSIINALKAIGINTTIEEIKTLNSYRDLNNVPEGALLKIY